MRELTMQEIGTVSGAGGAADVGAGIAALGAGILAVAALPELTIGAAVVAGVGALGLGFGSGLAIGSGLRDMFDEKHAF